MADFWNRVELANPPRHIEKKRKDAVYEWIPCAGSKRKLDLTEEEKRNEEASKPSAKLFAVDETVQDYVLDSDGYMRDTASNSDTNYNAAGADMDIIPPKSETAQAEVESMAMDECEDNAESGLRECMVGNENVKNGGGNGNCVIGKGTVEYTSLILSNEVLSSMAKRPVDISTVLAQEMVKQATMAVVLWKPLLPSPSPTHGIIPNSNFQNQVSPSSDTASSPCTPTNCVGKEFKSKNSNDEEMETSENI